MNEIRRHVYGNSVDRFTIKQLINRLTAPTQSCKISTSSGTDSNTSNMSQCRGHLVALNISECVSAFDIKEETLITYLCYLEFEHWIELHKATRDTCVLKFYGGQTQIDQLIKKMDFFAACVECSSSQGEYALLL